MSMYTQLLEAACEQRPARGGASERDAIDQVLRSHGELAERARVNAGVEDDIVSVILALELRYDVALVELAGVLGIDTGPSRFEQPHRERERLVRAFRARGVTLEPAGPFVVAAGSGPAPTR